MDLDTQRKEEWCISLQFFLASRLRTPSYAVASRQHPFIRVPPMIPRTQFLLDGIVWAVNDHPSWVESAWLTIQNHIKDTATRFAEVSDELTRATAAAASAASSSGTITNAISSMIAPRGSALDRGRTYQAHAAVQDVYLAFCVMDALVKGVRADVAGKLHEVIGKELPQLVAYYVPVFAPATSYWVANAVDEYRHLFHALLDSWIMQSTFNSDVHRRLQEYLQHRLQHTREAEEDEQKQLQQDAAGSSAAKVNGGRSGVNSPDVWGTSVQHIIDSTARVSAEVMAAAPTTNLVGSGVRENGGQPAAVASAKNAALRSFERGVRSPDTVERTLRSFLNSIFPPRNTPAARYRCPHCGAPLRDDKSKNAHYRCHFYARNFLKPEEKLVRLMYPSAADFAEHTGDLKREGHFTRTVEVLEEAYKGGNRGAVKIRRLEEPPADSNGPPSLA
ncbi:hypothetical protein, conserved [Leishmania donovani]|uniref:C2H2-type domain-containing protein n=1 Tax=Leishmania donovani TaxID=5661 RepID=E9BKZ9_LEIDO|nr:hypothetical protein, conserved [Leishmania donovani]CBZ35927.1 hypothetical protein, conserved [Leishmania donovani]